MTEKYASCQNQKPKIKTETEPKMGKQWNIIEED